MIVSATEILLNITERVASGVDFQEVLSAVFRLASGQLKFSRMSLVAFDDPGGAWRAVAQQGDQERAFPAGPERGRITPELRSLSSRYTRSAFVVEDYLTNPDATCVHQMGAERMRSGIHAFRHAGGQLTGGFFVQHSVADAYAERDSLFVYALAQAVCPVLEQWDYTPEGGAKSIPASYSAPPVCSERSSDSPTHIVGSSDVIRRLDEEIRSVAPTEATALLIGETGTGKELVATKIFELSKRRNKPFIAVNCAALSPDLVASELFGHVAGAFTGATSAHKGRFELADGGTLFLDEIGDLPMQTQVKLLRTLESGEYQKVGDTKTHTTDVRIIAATHRDLEAMAAQGLFRPDLFYRLNVFPIRLPPLRERRDDIRELAIHFAHLCAKQMDRPLPDISASAIEALRRYSWMGNVRELRNVMERSVILSNRGPIGRVHLPPALTLTKDSKTCTATLGQTGHARTTPADAANVDQVDCDSVVTLEDAMRLHILKALGACDGKVSGKGGAADVLGVNPKTLESKMRKLGIQRCWS